MAMKMTGDDDNLGFDIEGVHNYWASSEDMDITYYRDNVGNIVNRRIVGQSTYDKYDYDALYQLKNVWYGYEPVGQTSDLAVAYDYDDLGNRNSVTHGSLVEQYYRDTYNELNQYSSVVFNSVTRNITYDLNGNMSQLGDQNFAYDYLNRMTSVIEGTYSEVYEYDAFGRRVSKTVGSTTTTYVYDGEF